MAGQQNGRALRTPGLFKPADCRPLIKEPNREERFTMTVLHDAPVVPARLPAVHPTACPAWCKDRHAPAVHHFGPSVTWHWSPQYRLANPRPLEGGSASLLRAELVRSDAGGSVGSVRLFVQAEGDVDLTGDEADAFIAAAEAFVERLRVLRRQMV
ncbi:DUF6907 domain-containing protein [Streptomyces sp. NPDC047821]|uniref:DUF6907 domain-containing protein n=1 Tax=Streptomyces sp. NPDC047821 TaxID=3365488 RepID=UPI003710C7FF